LSAPSAWAPPIEIGIYPYCNRAVAVHWMARISRRQGTVAKAMAASPPRSTYALRSTWGPERSGTSAARLVGNAGGLERPATRVPDARGSGPRRHQRDASTNLPALGLNGKIALVTVAASGIGHSIAKRFLEADGRVVIADLKLDAAKAAAAALAGPKSAMAVAMDVANEPQVEAGVQQAVAA